ncbi:non-hydrolyzing UDP-N-acetylglucosamine 2-epimerase [Enterococcus avium]|uniref:non-hydrolyzing UDP-N-acetylglucosamine 2-epimerase n=1 Tax=Enterococcus avium TaxID=33945 RepID=UPI001F58CB33|nr:UDP-N-acetylglucosamine 2-epimerase (non-hydrolyzing) [Enterococcus avium]
MRKKIKVMFAFGTRPEAIKMIPIIKKMNDDDRFITRILVTAQHREMLDQVLDTFEIHPDYDLNIMVEKQNLVHITNTVLEKVSYILEQESPNILLVHGDTTTTYASALAAFYKNITIGHVEAGLRTGKKYSPFPEEMNRQLTDVLTDIYFAPTEQSKKNLLLENHKEENIIVTGNTAIDMMKYTIKNNYVSKTVKIFEKDQKIILLTMHRRENIGKPMENVFKAIRKIASLHSEVKIVFPMHKNPVIRQLAKKVLGSSDNIYLVEPLSVEDFHNLCSRSYMVLTDSGGIQEEAPSFGVPVLVLRDTTERPEGVDAGTLKLIGTEELGVLKEIETLLIDEGEHKKMTKIKNPYGDGFASEKILEGIINYFSSL